MIDNEKRASLRGMVRAGLGVLAAGATIGRASAQDQKIAQSLVQYQATPKEKAQCDGCTNWAPPNACKIVVGDISPKGWCVAYAPKEG